MLFSNPDICFTYITQDSTTGIYQVKKKLKGVLGKENDSVYIIYMNSHMHVFTYKYVTEQVIFKWNALFYYQMSLMLEKHKPGL